MPLKPAAGVNWNEQSELKVKEPLEGLATITATIGSASGSKSFRNTPAAAGTSSTVLGDIEKPSACASGGPLTPVCSQNHDHQLPINRLICVCTSGGGGLGNDSTKVSHSAGSLLWILPG